ncbi:UNVERIFIED_CONTAM: hypothetical protein O8I53_05345 [Campylobacter lari]
MKSKQININKLINLLDEYNYRIESIDFINQNIYLNVADLDNNKVCQLLINQTNELLLGEDVYLSPRFISEIKYILN